MFLSLCVCVFRDFSFHLKCYTRTEGNKKNTRNNNDVSTHTIKITDNKRVMCLLGSDEWRWFGNCFVVLGNRWARSCLLLVLFAHWFVRWRTPAVRISIRSLGLSINDKWVNYQVKCSGVSFHLLYTHFFSALLIELHRSATRRSWYAKVTIISELTHTQHDLNFWNYHNTLFIFLLFSIPLVRLFPSCSSAFFRCALNQTNHSTLFSTISGK